MTLFFRVFLSLAFILLRRARARLDNPEVQVVWLLDTQAAGIDLYNVQLKAIVSGLMQKLKLLNSDIAFGVRQHLANEWPCSGKILSLTRNLTEFEEHTVQLRMSRAKRFDSVPFPAIYKLLREEWYDWKPESESGKRVVIFTSLAEIRDSGSYRDTDCGRKYALDGRPPWIEDSDTIFVVGIVPPSEIGQWQKEFKELSLSNRVFPMVRPQEAGKLYDAIAAFLFPDEPLRKRRALNEDDFWAPCNTSKGVWWKLSPVMWMYCLYRKYALEYS